MRPTFALLCLFTVPAAAQTPWYPRPVLIVNDSTNDRLTVLKDLDGNGDYNGPGESGLFYDDTLGPYALSNNVGIASTRDGRVFVADSSTDQVLLLRDLDGDGVCHSNGEALLYFESLSNAAAIAMPSAGGIFEQDGVLWVSVSQTGSGGKDFVLRLEDLNGDDDAQDAGEALEYFVRSDLSQGGSLQDSLVYDVRVGLDGHVYYLELSSNGMYAKGIYKLVDLDNNGTIDPLAEVFPFFIPGSIGAVPFYWGFDQAPDGTWYMADAGNDLIWRAHDSNGDGTIGVGESTLWWQSPTNSYIWNVRWASDGALYAGESQDNERVLRLFDTDGSGSIDPQTEVSELFDDLLTQGLSIGQLRGFVLDALGQRPGLPYCVAQVNTLGCSAQIGSAGTPSATHGSGFLIQAAQLRNQKSGLLFYGTVGRQASPFLGGTLCVATPLVRTPLSSSGGNTGLDDCSGVLTFDFNAYLVNSGNPALVAGATVDAQFWSRDPGASSNTNLSNALEFALLP